MPLPDSPSSSKKYTAWSQRTLGRTEAPTTCHQAFASSSFPPNISSTPDSMSHVEPSGSVITGSFAPGTHLVRTFAVSTRSGEKGSSSSVA